MVDDGDLAGSGTDIATSVLAKPFTAETLATQVREALDRRPSKTVPTPGAQIASPWPAVCQPLTVGGLVAVSIATTRPCMSATQSPEWPPYGT